jgi:hypothetical protein
MGNMSYCMFENTFTDLKDCRKRLINTEFSKLSDSEKEYRNNLIKLCKEISENFETKEINETEETKENDTKQIKKEYFIDKSNNSLIKHAKEYGLCSIENHHLTAEGLIAKMYEWDESEHGVEKYIYDLTKKDLKKLGAEMPKDIRRIK